MQPCRFCCQEVSPQARRCPHCRSDLTTLGKLRFLQPIVSVLIAVGGSVYGFYERQESKKSKGELELEQAAMVQVLDSVPPGELAAKYKNDSTTEEQLKQELRRNPRNLDARIRLRMKQRSRRTTSGKERMAEKSRTGRRG